MRAAGARTVWDSSALVAAAVQLTRCVLCLAQSGVATFGDATLTSQARSRQAPHPTPLTHAPRLTKWLPLHPDARRKVANIKCELLNDFASTTRARRAAVLADDAALEPDAVRQGQDANAAVAPPAQDDGFVELTVDAEFERLVGGE